MRYPNQLNVKILFYGAGITEAEKATARKLATANSINQNSNLISVAFVEDLAQMGGQKI